MTDEIAPLRLISKLRNNRMIRAREQLGMSGTQIAEAIGIHYGTWILLESLKGSPLCKNGQWRPIALLISDWFKVMPEDMWPAEALAVEQSTVEIEVSASEAHLLMGSTHQDALPDYHAELEVRALDSALHTLTPREDKILRLRFGIDGPAKTLQEVGDIFELCSERIRFIEARAIRKLRHPLRAKRILGAGGDR